MIEGKRYQTRKEKKGALYVKVSNMKDDIDVLEVTNKTMEQLEMVIKGLDLQPIGPKDVEDVAHETLSKVENYDILEEVQEFMSKNTKEERPEVVPMALVSIGKKGETIFDMSRAP